MMAIKITSRLHSRVRVHFSRDCWQKEEEKNYEDKIKFVDKTELSDISFRKSIALIILSDLTQHSYMSTIISRDISLNREIYFGIHKRTICLQLSLSIIKEIIKATLRRKLNNYLAHLNYSLIFKVLQSKEDYRVGTVRMRCHTIFLALLNVSLHLNVELSS